MTGYTIAHFTDAHLPLHGGFRLRELLCKRGLSALNWVRRRRWVHQMEIADALRADILAHKPDHVAMTGDVVNFGLKREFESAAEWLREFGPTDALSFVPGNHEAMIRGAEAAREKTFSAFTSGDEASGWPWVRKRGPVALIGVTTAISTSLILAQGEVGRAQLDRLRQRLAETRGLCRVVMIHHPPTPLSSRRKELRDRVEVSNVLAAEGAELVLHGHNHKNQLSWIDGEAGRIPVLGAPAASTPGGPAHEAAEWRLLTVREAKEGFEIAVLRRALNEAGTFEDRGRFVLPPMPARAAG